MSEVFLLLQKFCCGSWKVVMAMTAFTWRVSTSWPRFVPRREKWPPTEVRRTHSWLWQHCWTRPYMKVRFCCFLVQLLCYCMTLSWGFYKHYILHFNTDTLIKGISINKVCHDWLIKHKHTFTESEEKAGSNVTAGSSFCKALITSCDQFYLRKGESPHAREKIHVVTALKCVLGVSQTAKVAALECKWTTFKGVCLFCKKYEIHLNFYFWKHIYLT